MKFAFVVLVASSLTPAQTLGPFTSQGGVGTLLRPGSVQHDPARGTFTITSSGENMWARKDDFYFIWTQASGDFVLSADISFPTKGGNAHRKAVLMFRQSLDEDSPYVDAAIHGDGLTSLQSRSTKGGLTHEVGTPAATPRRVRLERRGDHFYMYLAGEGEQLRFAGGSMNLALQDPYYLGIGVCAHDKDALEQAVFSNVAINTTTFASHNTPYSTLETVRATATTDRRVVYAKQGGLVSPLWSSDGKSILFSDGASIKKIAAQGGAPPEEIATSDTRSMSRSTDGKRLTFRDKRGISVMPATGGKTQKLLNKDTTCSPSWSPDGSTLVYAVNRGAKSTIYKAAADGRKRSALGEGQQPEFSADSKYIYFVSKRSGTSQIWRMGVDGSNSEQITADQLHNTAPHISPDGQRLAFLSSEKQEGERTVLVRMMNLTDKRIAIVAEFKGSDGVFGSPAWSPDSRQLTFVSRQYLP